MGRGKLIGQNGGGTVQFDYSNYFGEQQDSAMSMLSNLGIARYAITGASVGNYALFAGGYYSNSYNTVDSYSKTLIKTTPTPLSYPRHNIAGASVGDYALFAGGYYGNGSTVRSEIDAFDKSLVKTTPVSLGTARHRAGGVGVANYAIFAGGQGVSSALSSVEVYNESLVKSSATNLSVARNDIASAKVGNYAVFAGDSNGSLVVDAYDTSLVRSTPTPLSTARNTQTSASTKKHAMFTGGSTSSSIIDTYDTSLVRGSTNLSTARYCIGCGVGNIAYFAGGGVSGSTTPSDVVDVFNESLIRSSSAALSDKRSNMAGASAGRFAIFAGGIYYPNTLNTVNAFTPYPEKVNLPVTKGSKYNFGSETHASENILLSLTTPINGYLKYKNGKFDFA